jgi:hypothetical protein
MLTALKRAIESVEYGSVEITLAEKGNYVEIIVKDKRRVNKSEDYHRG